MKSALENTGGDVSVPYNYYDSTVAAAAYLFVEEAMDMTAIQSLPWSIYDSI